ncbi:MAG TPA: DUF4870 domain-containing protein [Puia sp.]|nr:DUF4870 domain-containing protein [Puia sp.]
MPEEYPLFTPTSDDRVLAMLSHILAIVGGLGFIPPLIIWAIKKDDPNASFVTENAKESLNFQLTVLILLFIGFCLIWVFLLGLALIWIVGIANLILVIIATVRTNEGKIYRYPFNFHLIK